MTITKRLVLCFVLMGAAIFATVLYAAVSLSRSQSRFEYVQANTIPSIKDLDKTIASANRLRSQLYANALTRDTAQKAENAVQIEASLKSIASLIDYYGKNDISDAKDQEYTNRAQADLNEIRAAMPEFIARSNSNDDAAALALLEGKTGIGAANLKLFSDLVEQIDYNVKLSDGLRADNAKAFTVTLWLLICGAIVVLAPVGFAAFRVLTHVRTSLSEIESTLTSANESLDLTGKVQVKSMDEVGRAGTAFNALMARVAEALGTVSTATSSVNTAAREIAAGNLDLSSRTEQQAASLEETASSMTELTQTVMNTAENARHANTLASSATAAADAGNTVVQTMVNTMGEISDSSSKISEITGLIEGIAFQTNILALNAAVEAARAGEQGRGFAVVATEVRTLAQRSSAAAKEIKALIESSTALINDGSEQASNVGQTMESVKLSIKQVADIVADIAAAAEEQSRGIEEVNTAVGQMDEVTQQNAALVEQAAAAAHSLEEQADRLHSAVGQFTL